MLRKAATTLDAVADPSVTGIVLATLEDAGAQVGRLQVGCCALAASRCTPPSPRDRLPPNSQ